MRCLSTPRFAGANLLSGTETGDWMFSKCPTKPEPCSGLDEQSWRSCCISSFHVYKGENDLILAQIEYYKIVTLF